MLQNLAKYNSFLNRCATNIFQRFNDHACSRVKACTMYIFNAKLKCSKTRLNAFMQVLYWWKHWKLNRINTSKIRLKLKKCSQCFLAGPFRKDQLKTIDCNRFKKAVRGTAFLILPRCSTQNYTNVCIPPVCTNKMMWWRNLYNMYKNL